MGFSQFAFASLVFFMTPSSVLLALSDKKRFVIGLIIVSTILFIFACTLFPQLSRDVLGVSRLMFRFYCYLVLMIGIFTGGILKAIELHYLRGILLVIAIVGGVNLLAFLYSFYA